MPRRVINSYGDFVECNTLELKEMMKLFTQQVTDTIKLLHKEGKVKKKSACTLGWKLRVFDAS